jgi:glycosyltransferase involved in cell wall biosynthesis
MPNKKPYRVLHCITDLHVGGAGRLLLRNLQHMDKTLFESHVCYLVPRKDLVPMYQAAGFRPMCMEHQSPLHGVRTVFRLVKEIRRARIDLVHTNLIVDHIYGTLAATFCGIPVITTLHSAVPGTAVDIHPRSKKVMVKRMIGNTLLSRRIQRFIAVSEAVREAQVRWRGLPAERTIVIYSGTALDEYDIGAIDGQSETVLRKQLGIDTDNPVLISVGRLDLIKGHRYLLSALTDILPRWPRCQLLLVGDGQERASLEQQSRELGLMQHVHFLGPRFDIPALLNLADIFVFPSLSEGLGLAVLEAMAAGKPIIASNIPAMAEVISHGLTGWTVEVGNSRSLAQGILQVLELPDKGTSVGNNARRAAKEKFSIETSVSRLEQTYLSVLEGN